MMNDNGEDMHLLSHKKNILYTSGLHCISSVLCWPALQVDVYKTWTPGPWTTFVDPVHGPPLIFDLNLLHCIKNGDRPNTTPTGP